MVSSNGAGGTNHRNSDTYLEAMASITSFLRATPPGQLTPIRIAHFADQTARSIRDSSETFDDDVRLCRLAAMEGTRQFVHSEAERLRGQINHLTAWISRSAS